MKIRTGDTVMIMSGRTADKGKTSTVVKAFPQTNKIIVKDVNMATRHIKKQGTTPGQIIQIEKPIDVSNVKLVCPFTEKPTRVGYVFVEEKGKTKKFRFSKTALKDKGGEASAYIIK